MHLLAAAPGTVSNGDEAIDLDQSPGDIVILTVADSDLACFARAAEIIGTGEAGRPSVRLANLLQLKHPYSVDLYVEKVIAHARFVCVVLLGGKSYWPYGVDEIANVARANGIAFAAVAEGHEVDPALDSASTVANEVIQRLREYLRQGGVANATGFLKTAATLIGRDIGVADDPVPLADAGLYVAGIERPTLDDARAHWVAEQPVALLVFYRALVAAGTLDAVDAMTAAFRERGLNVLAAHVRSLREPYAVDWLGGLIDASAPDVIVNATAFAATSPGENRVPGVLERADCPILQIASRASSRTIGPIPRAVSARATWR
jgi:cobaltochelatase CobN